MHTLADFASELQRPESVRIGAITVPLVRQSAAVHRAVRDAIPEPRPTRYIKNPTRGDLAPPIPDENDPPFIAAHGAWLRRVQAADVGLALLAGGVDGLPARPDLANPEAVRTFADACDDALSRAFTARQLATLAAAVYGASIEVAG